MLPMCISYIICVHHGDVHLILAKVVAFNLDRTWESPKESLKNSGAQAVLQIYYIRRSVSRTQVSVILKLPQVILIV